MNQERYNLIIKAIKFAMPAIADELIVALNSCVQLSNERLDELKALEEAKADKAKTNSEVKENK